MNEHPADVAPASGLAETPPFFAVSITKLVVMSTVTFGLYGGYWFYWNWQIIRNRERANISPAARAVFALFYCHACFARIRDYEVRPGEAAKFAAGPLAAGWTVASLIWLLPDPYAWLTLLAVVFMIPVQARANEVNQRAAPGHRANDTFSAWNWVAIVVGGLILVAGLFGGSIVSI